MCALTTILFLGGWLPPFDFAPFTWIPGVIWFVLKLCFVFFMFAMVKAFVPRYRYDQLMRLGWKVFLPLSLFMVVVDGGVPETHGAGLMSAEHHRRTWSGSRVAGVDFIAACRLLAVAASNWLRRSAC